MVISSKSYFFFFFVSLIFHTLASPSFQREALLDFKNEFPFAVRDVDFPLSSWNTSSDQCSWEGVTCNGKSSEVISLFLENISLNGSLKSNSSLFKLQYLRSISFINCDLTGEIPSSLGNLSYLLDLDLSSNQLVGEIPSSLGNLSHLVHLDLCDNYFLAGEVPPCLGNLHQLTYLNLLRNNLSGNIPTSFAKLTKLSFLYLSENQFTGGDFSRILPNLTSLSELHLEENHIKSKLPSDLSGLHNLVDFDASGNSLFGNFPTSLFGIPTLRYLRFRGNQFEGPLELRNRSSSSHMLDVDLSHNSFTKLVSPSSSKLGPLDLFLDLSYNKLEGQVPSFFWRLSVLKLSHNSLSSLDKPLKVSVSGSHYDLGFNSLQGPFPLWICNFTKLVALDLSNNHLTGSIPPCLKNSITCLRILHLRNNNLSGILPDIFINATVLKSLDGSHNQLVGNLPRSLINCSNLEFLNLKGNKIKGISPSWLQSLGQLHILLLGSNAFYGPIDSPGFPSLRVIDISHNSFNGTLPQDNFANWAEMFDAELNLVPMISRFPVEDVMDMMYKGVETEFSRIFDGYRAIDFSGNKFTGRIPKSIGMLKGLRLLNLSNNAFTGNIPSSLANITDIEALDLSRNKLSGQIPHDLGKLSFISYLDFSHNFLQGPVPRSTQFQRQECSSFEDNRGLNGLEEICGDIHVPDAAPQQPEEVLSEPEEVFSWTAAAIAYVLGVFCGLVIGHIFFTLHKLGWFLENFGRRKPTGITSVR